MHVRRAAAALLALLVLLVFGCRTPVPAGPPLSVGDPRPGAWVERLADSARELQTLRGRTRVSIEGTAGGAFSRQLLVVERPAQLRLEVLGMVGQRVAVLATDGARYDLFRAEQPGVETGDVHDGILWEAAGLPLTLEEAVDLAFGTPVGATPRVGTARSIVGEAGIEVDLDRTAQEAYVTLEFGAEGRLVRYLRRSPVGAAVLDAHYHDYRDVGGRSFAHRIDVDFPAAETHAKILFQSVELNPELPENLFRLQLPGAAPESRAPWMLRSWSPSAS